jgi:hypothetical protein
MLKGIFLNIQKIENRTGMYGLFSLDARPKPTPKRTKLGSD